ncbi:Ribosomal large subunit pseudouridine synthase E [Halomicronema hongdechloris C2206]|uniref:Pseudouridine synthase n=1 Tax=Halomicronema hongdechloris C2206 TaxID=1641165 RepID=A0A1Z3HPY3_9CYAN|nr:pseudouridine synthase [Halomicronema hongdechloris]ASC72374.1 Ribosomal large subunit pseudouridine synthase E [Halomicronema hongdechloris C2206]
MPYRYLLFYKPYHVLSQFRAPDSQRSTLQDYIPTKGVYPVGRLDYDSEGLMLLSDHGQLQHRLSHPRYGHPRTYWVQVEHLPGEAALEQLRRGVTVQGKLTQPAQVRRLFPEPRLPPRDPPIRVRKTVPTAWIEVTLGEGRNRQVRRMTAAVGHPTLRLVRVAIAHLQLAGLTPGEWRFLTDQEQASLLALMKRQPE